MAKHIGIVACSAEGALLTISDALLNLLDSRFDEMRSLVACGKGKRN